MQSSKKIGKALNTARYLRNFLIIMLVARMQINTRKLALSATLGAATWTIKAAMPGVPLDFAIPGAKIDFGWAPAVLATVLIGIEGGLVTGFCMSLVPIPTLFLTGFLWTPWTLAATGYLAINREWGWKAALVFPLLHVPIGCAIFTWVLPVFSFFAWQVVMPAIFVAEYTGSIIAAMVARYIQRGKSLDVNKKNTSSKV